MRARLVLLPTLTVFLLQRYWASRWSSVSVTGKPSGRTLRTTERYMRWPCILGAYGAMFLIVALYMPIIVGSLPKVGGWIIGPISAMWKSAWISR